MSVTLVVSPSLFASVAVSLPSEVPYLSGLLFSVLLLLQWTDGHSFPFKLYLVLSAVWEGGYIAAGTPVPETLLQTAVLVTFLLPYLALTTFYPFILLWYVIDYSGILGEWGMKD